MNFLDDRLPSRFWDKVIPEPNSGCWLWIAGTESGGYGAFFINGKSERAHRITAAIVYGKTNVLDHKCRTRRCCNPAHLEDVTLAINTLRGEGAPAKNARKTHCPRGHELAGTNLINYSVSFKKRECRICHNATANRARDRRAA